MDAKEFAQQLRGIVSDLKETRGIESIASENLITYLDEAVRDLNTPAAQPSETTIERYKAELQRWVEEQKYLHAQGVEMFRSVIQAGQNAVQAAFLMNGGASIALLAFIGHLSGVAPQKIPTLAPSLTLFVCGVLAAGLTAGTTYLSQLSYAVPKKRTGVVFHVVAIVFGAAAYILFAFGMWQAYRVFVGFDF